MAVEEKYCIFDQADAEYDEKRSRFIGLLFPVKDEEEAKEYVNQVKKKYYDARHHCYAYIIGYDAMQKKSSDDGEPSGTAGKPILEILETKGLFNVLLVVVRYFGGIKLGTGGLTRAYREAARLCVEEATLSEVQSANRFEITVDYSMGATLENYFRRDDIIIEGIDYSENETIRVLLPEEKIERVMGDLQNMLGTEDLPPVLDSIAFCESDGRITVL